MSTAITKVDHQITFSNYRIEYVAPDYGKGHTFEPRCAILADDAEFNGATVRVFDVPDPDENQRAVAQFACDAMNQHEELRTVLQLVRDTFYRHTCKLHGPMVCDKCEALNKTDLILNPKDI